jgi:hypothetical protein
MSHRALRVMTQTDELRITSASTGNPPQSKETRIKRSGGGYVGAEEPEQPPPNSASRVNN